MKKRFKGTIGLLLVAVLALQMCAAGGMNLVIAAPGDIVVSVSNVDNSAQFNLDDPAFSEWTHYGDPDQAEWTPSPSITKKVAATTNIVGAVKSIGSAFRREEGVGVKLVPAFSWTGGTPSASATQTRWYSWTGSGASLEQQFNFPAGDYVAKIYLIGLRVTSDLTVTGSISGEIFSQSGIFTLGGWTDTRTCRLVTINYNSDTAETVTLSLTNTATNSGSMAVQAITIEDLNAQKLYAVSAAASPYSGGTVTGDGGYPAAATVNMQAVPDKGYAFKEWRVVSENLTLANNTAAAVTFVMPSENVELRAVFSRIEGQLLDLTRFVNMRVGTTDTMVGGSGSSNTLIGTQRPNASVSPGPDTSPQNFCTGFDPDAQIIGFSQIHVSGTGAAKYGQFLVSPQTGLSTRLDSHGSAKADETPTCSEYSVTLSKYDVKASFTPAEHSTIYKFVYPENTQSSVVLDVVHNIPGGAATNLMVNTGVNDKGEPFISGSGRYAGGWGSAHDLYFYAVLQKTSATLGLFNASGNVAGTSMGPFSGNLTAGGGAYATFPTTAGETVYFKIATSFKSVDQAKTWLEQEIPAWDYSAVYNETERQWNEELNKVIIDGDIPERELEIFYTALYHSYIMPRDRTGDIAAFGASDMIDDQFCVWDTWRTVFPLYAITSPEIVAKAVNSFIARYRTNGYVRDAFVAGVDMPEQQGGDNIDNVIADAYAKNIPGVDWEEAYAAAKNNAENYRLSYTGNGNHYLVPNASSEYKTMGYIPTGTTSVMNCSITLEYAYNDFCVAQVAKGLGLTADYDKYLARSNNWTNIWNPDLTNNGYSGFINPRASNFGAFTSITPTQNMGSWNNYFYEASSWNYSFFVPHDVKQLIEKMGGQETFANRLKLGIDNGWVDLTNEPAFLAPFLFNYTSKPWLTSDVLTDLRENYTLVGVPDNDDSGAMSSWYIFASTGFFPNAGQDIYYISSPIFEQTTFNLGGGKQFKIIAHNLSADNKYIQSVKINGVPYFGATFTHDIIANGGVIEYEMGSDPVNYARAPSNDVSIKTNKGVGELDVNLSDYPEWAHFTGAATTNRKAGVVNPVIGNVSIFGSGSLTTISTPASQINFSWSDGVPTPTASANYSFTSAQASVNSGIELPLEIPEGATATNVTIFLMGEKTSIEVYNENDEKVIDAIASDRFINVLTLSFNCDWAETFRVRLLRSPGSPGSPGSADVGIAAAVIGDYKADAVNIAKNRAVWHSTSANYLNTGHLTTDGIFKPGSVQTGPVASQRWTDSPAAEEVIYAFDGLSGTKYLAFHPTTWVQYEFPNGEKHAVNGYTITTGNDQPTRDPRIWNLYGVNDDGSLSAVLDARSLTQSSNGLGARGSTTSRYTFANATEYKGYRYEVTANHGNTETNSFNSERGMIQFAELTLYEDNTNVISVPKQVLDSCWQSAATGNQYVYVDLGGESTFDEVALFWDTSNYATAFQIQVSDDAKDWSRTVYSTTAGAGGNPQVITFNEVSARYVRLYLTASQGTSYRLYEFEVYGENDVVVAPKPLPPEEPDGRQMLRGGNWKLQRASEVTASGAQLSAAFDDSDWVPATVPGTVLVSYLNNGSIPDPNYADWQFQISDSFFTADFWYRDSFAIPSSKAGQTIWLNFNNINWKADVYFNGTNVGKIEGAFIRSKFDVTTLANIGGENYVAVYIYKNDTPGAVDPHSESSAGTNGGVLGTDNPTIHASIGWDWVPTIRGRDIGIYGDVFLSYSRTAQLADPWIVTHLDGVGGSASYNAAIDLTNAHLTFKTDVTNSTGAAITNAVVKGVIQPGNITYEQAVGSIPANGTTSVVITLPDIANPQLWWPNRYGDQFLYTNTSTVEVGGVVSDTKTFKFGVRELRWSTSGVFTIYVNGARIYCTGGNWGMDESMLRMDAEWYDICVRLHKEAGFTMIRNWVGMTGGEGFYEACDKYGILVMDDFWLANPSDGPNPHDNAMFMENANDKIKVVRKHVSVAFYCGRNEGQPPGGSNNTGSGTSVTPPTNLNTALREAVAALDGSRMYVADSAAASEGVTLSGHGSYSVSTGNSGGPVWYFNNSGNNFHTERGLPNVPSLESIKRMMPEENLWPVPSTMWGLHDFTTGSAQNGTSFINQMNLYGSTAVANTNVNEFVRRAQMVNYENHKALFEAPQVNRSQAMLMWMSQSAWPSMVWHAADYYHDTNAGYFAIKAANQTINALYDQQNKRIVVSNNCGKAYNGLTLEVDRYNLNGEKLRDTEVVTFNITADQAINNLIATPVIASSATNVNFIVTRVKDSAGNEISRNFYWITLASTRSFTELQSLPAVTLSTTYNVTHEDTTNIVKAKIINFMNAPALMIRVKALTESGEQILPTYYSDNYFSLMPGEMRDVVIEFDDKHLNGEQPQFFVEGWNITPMELGAGSDEPYLITGVRFVKNGSEITAVSSGDVSFEATIIAMQDIDMTLRPIIAVYNADGRLTATSDGTANLSMALGDTMVINSGDVQLPSDYTVESLNVKGFLWDAAYAPLLPASVLNPWAPSTVLPNLALDRKTFASSASGDHPMQWGNDGSTSSYWQTGGTLAGDMWYMVDLGFDADINKVIVTLGPNAATNTTRIDFATEGAPNSFIGASVLPTYSANATNTFTFDVGDVCARYVRVYRPGAVAFSVAELEVYGFPIDKNEIRMNQPFDIIGNLGTPISASVSVFGYYGTGVALSADLSELPTSAAFDESTGVLTWTPVSDTEVGAYYVTFAVNNGYTADSKTFKITVKYPNLAQGKTATASSSDDTSRQAQNSVDGNYNSRWASSSNNDQWLYVDLGQECTVGKVTFYWEAAYPSTFRVDYAVGATAPSATSSSWTQSSSITGTIAAKDDDHPWIAGVQTYTFATPVTARYIRFYGLTRATTYGFSFYEMEVYEN